jgi:hypothetical protein
LQNCSAALRTCRQRAHALALGYLEQPASVPPTLVTTGAAGGGGGGDAALYDRYFAKMQASVATPEEYYRFFNALAPFPTGAARSHAEVRARRARSQDTPLLLGQLLGVDTDGRGRSSRPTGRR